MATLRQKRLARAIIENSSADKPLNKEELVISSGYAVKTAEGHAPNIIEQKGVQEELEVLGFNEYNAKNVVQQIMLDEKTPSRSRLTAADMVFKVHGTYAAEKHINLNIDAESTGRTEGLADRLNGLFRR